jgi:hypothetical protein
VTPSAVKITSTQLLLNGQKIGGKSPIIEPEYTENAIQ